MVSLDRLYVTLILPRQICSNSLIHENNFLLLFYFCILLRSCSVRKEKHSQLSFLFIHMQTLLLYRLQMPRSHTPADEEPIL